MQSTVKVKQEEVTPERARQWLQQNRRNRRVRETKVATYARDMANGNWTTDVSAICFAEDGTLINGQHRLLAVVESGATIRFVVMRGTPMDAMKTMDSGVRRTTGDALSLRGERYALVLASVARLAMQHQTGTIQASYRKQDFSSTEIIDFIGEHPDLRDWARIAVHLRSRLQIRPSICGAAGWTIAQVAPQNQVETFFDSLYERTELKKGSPVLALDYRLRQLQLQRARVDRRAELGLYIMAWNAWRQNKKVDSFTLPRSSEPLPEPVA